jgi:uncharacterized YigZ family protein
MADGYAIPAAEHRVETVIDRSRFVASVARAAGPAEARAFIDRIRAEFPDATHNCWAYQAGPPGSTAAVGMSDAGEPHGTAGRPMLDVLLHSGVGEIVAVVTRYYGGIKLGKGGLVRAYGGCVQQALASMPRTVRVDRAVHRLVVAWADHEPVRRLLAEAGALIEEERFGAEVELRVALPAGDAARTLAALTERTAGRIRAEPAP